MTENMNFMHIKMNKQCYHCIQLERSSEGSHSDVNNLRWLYMYVVAYLEDSHYLQKTISLILKAFQQN